MGLAVHLLYIFCNIRGLPILLWSVGKSFDQCTCTYWIGPSAWSYGRSFGPVLLYYLNLITAKGTLFLLVLLDHPSVLYRPPYTQRVYRRYFENKLGFLDSSF